MATGWEAWESYFYPETYDPETRQGTLRNKFGERDADRLEVLERAASAMRAREISQGLVTFERTFGLAHLQALHRHLFQDAYDWAGEVRTVRMHKSDDSEFARPRSGQIDELMGQVQEFVHSMDIEHAGRGAFVKIAAATFAYANQAHPFREGNSRATQWFMRHLAERSRFGIDFTRTTREDLDRLSAASSPTAARDWIDVRPLIPLFDAAVGPRTAQPAPPRPVLRPGLSADPNTGPVTGRPGSSVDGPSL